MSDTTTTSLLFNMTTTFQQTERKDCKLFNFVTWGCVVIILCCFGYVGNFLSFFALKRDARSSAIVLLQALAVSDAVLLLSVNLIEAVPYVCEYSGHCPNLWHSWPWIRYFWLFIPVGHMCSIWLVVLIAANRYWAVCKPYTANEVWSKGRTYIYVAAVVISSLILNIPRLFEYKFVDVPAKVQSGTPHGATVTVESLGEHVTLGNLSSGYLTNDSLLISYNHQDTVHFIKKECLTAFGNSTLYKVGYKVVLVNVILVILPLPFLFLTSIWIIRSLKISERLRSSKKNLSKHGSIRETKSDSARTNPSKEVTLLLMAVVLVAVACQTPLAVFHFVRYTFTYKCGDTVYYLESGSKLLVTFNSCVNFVIYCVLSPKFRRLLKETILCKNTNNTPRIQTSATTRQPTEESPATGRITTDSEDATEMTTLTTGHRPT